MEVIELADHGYVPHPYSFVQTNNFQNAVYHQPFQHHENEIYIREEDSHHGGGIMEATEAYEVVELVDSQPQPLVNNVNYVYGPNGALIPVLETFPVGNNFTTFTALSSAPDPSMEPSVPSHILDHMYAKKAKDPGKEVGNKPKKRVKKKAPLVVENQAPELIPVTTKVNIIRKGIIANLVSRPVISRPKILQNTKTVATSSSVVPTSTFPQQMDEKKPQVNFSSPLPSTFTFSSPTSETKVPVKSVRNGITIQLRPQRNRPLPPSSVPSSTPVFVVSPQQPQFRQVQVATPTSSQHFHHAPKTIGSSPVVTAVTIPQQSSRSDVIPNYCIVLPPVSGSSNGGVQFHPTKRVSLPSRQRTTLRRAEFVDASSGFTFLTRARMRESPKTLVTYNSAEQQEPEITIGNVTSLAENVTLSDGGLNLGEQHVYYINQ